jgi:hypothetical protein
MPPIPLFCRPIYTAAFEQWRVARSLNISCVLAFICCRCITLYIATNRLLVVENVCHSDGCYKGLYICVSEIHTLSCNIFFIILFHANSRNMEHISNLRNFGCEPKMYNDHMDRAVQSCHYAMPSGNRRFHIPSIMGLGAAGLAFKNKTLVQFEHPCALSVV